MVCNLTVGNYSILSLCAFVVAGSIYFIFVVVALWCMVYLFFLDLFGRVLTATSKGVPTFWPRVKIN